MLLFVLVFISFVVSPGSAANDDGRFRIFSCSENEFQCLNGTCVRSHEECGAGQACVLPEYPRHGAYIMAEVLVSHPRQVFESFLLRAQCDQRYGVVKPNGSVTLNGTHDILCVFGRWAPKTLPSCVRYCTLPPDPSVKYSCRVPGSQEFKPCGLYVPDGTTVEPQCRTPIYYTHRTLNFMNCRNGVWDYIARCEADCGRVTPDGTELIINGTTAKRGELPWHVAIYTKESSPYEQICGGTLVSNDVVISAAHCFWNDVETKVSASKYAVGVGKLYRQWKSEHDTESQESDVKEIRIPERFQGTWSTLQSDLAALILVTPFVFEDHVKPVCMSFSRDFDRVQLQVGNRGKVAGWGLTAANGSRSNILNVVELPYIDYNICVREVPNYFQQFIPLDTFCAGYTTGTTVCRGDSGGGLAFATPDQYTERYYLRGVVSAAPTDSSKECNDQNYAIFTRIADYEDFIKESLQGRSFAGGPDRPFFIPCAESQFLCDDGTCMDRREDCKGVQKCVTGSEAACFSEETVTKSPFIFSHVRDMIHETPAESGPADPEVLPSKREEVPWHVGIYDADHSSPIYAGSIISERTDITSAVCAKHRKSLTALVLVAAGQTYLKINDPRNVKDSAVQYLYLAGWNLDTEEIMYTDLPYIKTKYCNNTLSEEDAKALTEGICTGYFGPKQHAISFQGGGLVYKEVYKGKERYYLRGVMATAATCGDEPNSCAFNFDSYIIFASLKPYEEFLDEFIHYTDLAHYISPKPKRNLKNYNLWHGLKFKASGYL